MTPPTHLRNLDVLFLAKVNHSAPIAAWKSSNLIGGVLQSAANPVIE